MKKLLFDTDIGSDIDDAVCLAYLLSQRECDLVGVTTVSGESGKRAQIASAICRAAGREVPILPGIERPLIVRQRQARATQAVALGRWPHGTSFPDGRAIEFMADAIRASPGEVTLLATGPLTNVAALFSVHPEVPGLLKELVLMCGVFTTSTPGVARWEWNAVCDPHAAAMVYAAPVVRHVSIGLDVTMRVSLSRPAVIERFTAPILEPVLDFASVWFKSCDRITFHDPLAGVSVFSNDILKLDRGDVEIELKSDTAMGATYWNQHPDGGRHLVASDVDAEAFFARYFESVGR